MSKQAKKLTLDDIAKLAGVSRATVSRVINKYPHITPDVRARVQKIISETGYQPNKIAQSLASQRTGIIGLVIPSATQTILSDPYFLHLISGITQKTNAYALTLSLFLFHSMDDEVQIAHSLFNTNLVDGLIITADRKENPFAQQVITQDIPFVVIGRSDLNTPLASVNVANEQGAYLATEHLITLGRRRLAIIMCDHNTAGDDRYAGYRRALADYDMAFDPQRVVCGDFSLESGYAAMQQLLSAKPDAVFVSSDMMAIGAQQAIRQAGLRIPDDIAVVGFDDLPQAALTDPPLTTIQQPIEELGMVAVDLLHDLMHDSAAAPRQVVLPIALIRRTT
ncbi:MAG: LacI family DNA-binding transcriptional regulator [Anaerolineae bacterium]|nr:LacI family DNA-binding transcriptional regulator [Anaerolineae bacterium]